MAYLKNKKSGFSLIELSIVILIASIFASSMINILGKKTLVDKNSDTKEKLARIGEALKVYWETDDRHYLPCPASLTIEINNDKMGAGGSDGSSDCPSGMYLKVDEHNGTKVVVGAVPIRELGLPPQYMFDSWGNRIDYIVDMNLTIEWTDTVVSNISLFDKNYSNGNTLNEYPNLAYINRLPLQKELTHYYLPCNLGDIIMPNGYDMSNKNNRIPDCPAFLLLSHGANGYLAFNSLGTVQKKTSFGMTPNERRNTNTGEGDTEISQFDNRFVYAPINQDTKANDINNSNYFDDILYYKSMSYFTGVTPPAGTPQ